MATLRAMAERLGFRGPRTLVATGNLVFEAPQMPEADVEVRLEAAFAETFGRHVDIIVRDAAHWPALIAANPYPREAESDPSRLIARVGRHPVGEGVVAALEPYRVEGEKIAAIGRDLWLHFPHGIGRSRLSAAITPKRAGIGTARNWNTVRGIGRMLSG